MIKSHKSMENDKTRDKKKKTKPVIRRRHGQTQFTTIGQKIPKREARPLITPRKIFESFIYLSTSEHVSFAISITY